MAIWGYGYFGPLIEIGDARVAESTLRAVSRDGAFKERHSVADRITDLLREAIQKGALADGTELNQVALSEHFGVSRVPVREALRALETEGWITAPTHYRAFVQGLSADRIEQIFDLRALLETHLIGKAIPHIDAACLADLRERCTAMDRTRNHDEWLAANRGFHRALLGPSGATMIIGLIEQLSSQVERYLRLRGAGRDRQAAAGTEHRAIVRAVKDRDTAQARKLLRAHIMQTRAAIVAVVEELRSSDNGKSVS
jgi:DNA-binding GntR family transcriptional regulator